MIALAILIIASAGCGGWGTDGPAAQDDENATNASNASDDIENSSSSNGSQEIDETSIDK